MKKQNFLQGAGILSLATIAVKVIGALYKIPLNNIIGKEGYSYFLQTYSVYSLLLVISTTGLPVAVSRMIASDSARGNYAQLRQTNRASLLLFGTLGLAGMLIMLLFSRSLAALMHIPDCSVTFLALGPAVLFVCVNASFRGYFQGQENMTPTGVSQVIEALFKLVLGLLLAKLILNASGLLVNSVAGAILGVTVGSAFAFLYLFLVFRRSYRLLPAGDSSMEVKSLNSTALELLSIAVPITIGSAGLQFFDLIDSSMVMLRLEKSAGLSYDMAKDLRGLYGTAQTLFGLPGALVIPFTATLIPAISSCRAKGDRNGAYQTACSEIRIMSMLILPMGVGMFALGEPIIRLLYHTYTPEDCAVAGRLLAILSIAVILNGLTVLLNALMQAHGYVRIPVVTLFIGGIIKVIVNYVLVGIPSLNIYGAPWGTVCCYVAVTALDVLCIRRLLPHPPRILPLMKKTILACAGMGVFAYAVNRLLSLFLSPKISCVLAIIGGAVVYFLGIVFLKAMTYEDCLLLPKGVHIAKLLRIKSEAENNN